MQYCPFCGQQNSMSAISCTRCGELQPTPPAVTAGVPVTHGSGIYGLSNASKAGVAPVRRSNHGSTRFLDARALENELRSPSPSSTRLRGKVKFVVEQGLIIGEQYLLNDNELYIGRHDPGSGYCPDIELSAQDSSFVHRSHAKLSFNAQGDVLTIKDLGGRNGVFVNNQSLGTFGETTLNVGDNVRIGRVALKLVLASPAESDGRG